MNTSRAGMMTTTDPAMSRAMFVSCCPVANSATATGSVYIVSDVATTSGHRNSFQLPRTVRIASVAEDVVLARPVDTSCVEELVGQPHDELAHQEDAKRTDEERQDQPGVRVHQSQVRDQHEAGHEGHNPGHHESGEHHHEQDPLTWELELRDRIAQHRA